MTKARNLAKLISDNLVGTAEIDDGAVTTAKLADDAVTSAKLNVTGGDISYDNSTSGISANTLQEAIDYLNVLSGGGSAGAQATYTREEFTATAGQTTFTTVNGYTLGYLQVFLNGVMLDSGDYTANDESTVVLGSGAAANDEVTTIAYDSFAISEVLRVLNISASAPDDTLTLSANGKVGVGVASPPQRLTVAHDGHGVSLDYVGALPAGAGMYTSDQAHTAQAYGDLNIKSRSDYSGYGIGLYTASSDNSPQLRLKVDASGRITMPYQPSFRAFRYVPISASDGVIVWQNAAHNIGNHYNTSTGAFTVPVNGTYHFAGNILMQANSSTSYVRVLFRINGSAATDFTDSLTGGAVGAFTDYNYHAVQIAQSFYLYAGDTVQMWNDNPNGSTYYSTGYGSFSGFLVG